MQRKLGSALVIASLLTGSSAAHAALWSLSNEVLVPPFGSVSPVLTFTGDGTTVGAQVDVEVPNAMGVADALPLNGGYCSILRVGEQTVVRALILSFNGTALVSAPTPVCQFTIRAPRPVPSGFLAFGYGECVDGLIRSVPCQLDRGYLTVVDGLPHW